MRLIRCFSFGKVSNSRVHYSSVNKNAMYKKMKVFKRYLDAGLFLENYYNKIIH